MGGPGSNRWGPHYRPKIRVEECRTLTTCQWVTSSSGAGGVWT
jgi:hypothetical protein